MGRFVDAVFAALRAVVRRGLQARLGPFRQEVVVPDHRLPTRISGPRRVLVIGAGLAGIAAASTLARRGVSVVMRDRYPYLGGKIGGWRATLSDGSTEDLGHGFHAFFRHYYNLDRFLERIGVRRRFREIDDYVVMDRDLRRTAFRRVETLPGWNLFSLAWHGVFRWRDLIFSPAWKEFDALLQYDPVATPRRFDQTSFQTFAERNRIPRSLRLVFDTFARAFFADERDMSLAELIKSFHFYYLSHDHGLIYDFPADVPQAALTGPMQEHLAAFGVAVELGREVGAITRDGEAFVVDGERFDEVVVATDSVGARGLLGDVPWFVAADPEGARRIATLRPGARYAVVHVWLDRPAPQDLPCFFSTERLSALDAICLLSNAERTHAAWAAQTGGSVVELHSYAVPEEMPDAAVRDALVAELRHFLPGLAAAQVVREHVRIRRDFTAFHVGMFADRPTTETAVPGLLLAGDWVALPMPAMLMEAAFTSGVFAANAVLRRAGVQEEPVFSVPPRGLLPPPKEVA